MGGTYMGKNWSLWPHLIKIHAIENPTITLLFAKMYEEVLVSHRAEVAKRKREQEERRGKRDSKSGRKGSKF